MMVMAMAMVVVVTVAVVVVDMLLLSTTMKISPEVISRHALVVSV